METRLIRKLLDKLSRWLGLNAYRICERCGEADAVRFQNGFGYCSICWELNKPRLPPKYNCD